MTEFLAQNKPNLFTKVKNNITYQIIFIMVCYWLIINIILLSLINVLNNYWKVIIGFNLGTLGSLVGFLILILASRWFVSGKPIKQVLAYFTFLVRMSVYSTIIILIIIFQFSSLISTIIGFSLLLVSVLTNEFVILRKIKKEQKKC